MRGGVFEPERALYVIGETARALDFAHRANVLHRDVKPANILLEEETPDRPGRVLLADFGIAKALAETQHLTKTGMLVASLQYTAPEQFQGIQLDGRTDVYSLGCTFYHLMTGQLPYPGTSLPELMYGHMSLPAPLASAVRPGLPAEIDSVIAQALSKNRDDRFPTCGALVAAAAQALGGSRSHDTVVSPRPYRPVRATAAGNHRCQPDASAAVHRCPLDAGT